MNTNHSTPQRQNALMLPGGGARGAYQAGAMRALIEIHGRGGNPFPIITGTSAGAINAAVLASHAHEFSRGVERLEYFWRSMHCSRIYRTGFWDALGSGLHWISSMVLGGLIKVKPRSLLDNQPLADFLNHEFQREGTAQAIRQGALRAVSISASGYSSASAVSFYQGDESIQPWERSRRRGCPTHIGVEHLMASAALPLLFPAQMVGYEYFGDGGMRQTAPLSPAIHLGATHILIIGTRDERPDDPPTVPGVAYPSLGEIAGYMLDVIFMDNLQADLARLHRVNHTLTLLDDKARQQSELRPIQTLLLRPSRDVRDVAYRHAHRVPASVRYLLRTVGAWGSGMRLPSYLLFEAPYCQELIDMGYEDTLARRAEVEGFFESP